MESGRLLQLLWLPLRPPPEGVCVSMLRVLLLRRGGTGGGARCPSGTSCGTMVSSFSGVSLMMMRSISWFRPSTLFRKRGADDLDIGMGIRMALGIGDCDWMMVWLPLNGDLRSLSLRWRLLRLLR